MNTIVEKLKFHPTDETSIKANHARRNSFGALQWCAKNWPDRDGLVFPLTKQRLSFNQWLTKAQQLAEANNAVKPVNDRANALGEAGKH